MGEGQAMKEANQSIEVKIDDLSSPQVQHLIAQHLAGMHSNSPAEHVHALALEGLKAPGMTFWSAWLNGELCGCGALKSLGDGAGEVKSMRTHHSFLRRGVAQAVLDEILSVACERGYSHLYLETGTGDAFDAAHALYLRSGFVWCGPFANYTANDFSVFMVKALDSADA
jgi:putative acetyltransferase